MPRYDSPEISSGRILTTLGGLSYCDGDSHVSLPGSAGTVVAFLALQDAATRRSVLSGTVWPEVNEARASGNLRSLLWRLRKSAPGLVSSEGNEVWISADVTIDFAETRAWADRILDGCPTERDLHRHVSPVALELLPGIYEDWAVFERERFRQRMLHASEQLAVALADRGHYADAIEAALSAICADPLRESAHRVAVECHLAENNVIEAHRQQMSYVRLLKLALDIAPSEDFMGLLSRAGAEPLRQPLADLRERVVS